MNTAMYREHILDHYKNPRNYGEMEDWDAQYLDCNPLCGDEVKIQVKFDGEVLKDVKFSGQGCAISLAAASMLTEMTKGKTKEEIKKLTNDDVFRTLAIPLAPSRVKCALLGLVALKKSIYLEAK